ncbi:MAG: cytochrome c3 family protein [Phycisphaeraceae bacterium]|nr:MAG: cytochrome c3 family protein [Phycisphaeraceae bacterium]
MSVLFPKWFNAFPTIAALGGAGALASVVGGFWYYATPKFFAVGYEPTQPGGGFSHQLHAGKLGMDCRYCHTHVETSPEANIPPVSTCMGCHADGRLKLQTDRPTHKERTQFIRDAYEVNASVEWRRVHKVPDYVRNFPHNIHIEAGVSCYSCHGQITQMPVVHQVEPLSMAWCLDCHRNTAPHLVERDRVTDLKWVEEHLKARVALGEQGLAQGRRFHDDRNLNPPETCAHCHY